MIYALRGGGIIQAMNSFELLQKLNELSLFGAKEDIFEYMFAVASEAKQEHNIILRVDSEEGFIEDLIKERYIIAIKEEDIFPDKSEFR